MPDFAVGSTLRSPSGGHALSIEGLEPLPASAKPPPLNRPAAVHRTLPGP